MTGRFPISENGWLIQDFPGIRCLVKLAVNEGFLSLFEIFPLVSKGSWSDSTNCF